MPQPSPPSNVMKTPRLAHRDASASSARHWAGASAYRSRPVASIATNDREVGQRQPHERLRAEVFPGHGLGRGHVGAEQRRGAADRGEVDAAGLGDTRRAPSSERSPLPIVATMPARSSAGVAASMRCAVVGPTAPAGQPAAGGVGPA